MALNIKPFYPREHPEDLISVGELISKISRPTSSATYLKSEVKKDDQFQHNEDIYWNYIKPRWKQEDVDINQGTLKLLDVI